MNEITIFENKEFGKVRTAEVNGKPYFCGKDVAEALGYADLNHAILDHVDEDDRVNSKTQGHFDLEFGQRGTWLINESGLYSLILSSKLESAKRFKHWVTSEVLPSIRKHGLWATDELVANPDLLISLATQLKEEREAKKVLAEKNEKLLVELDESKEWYTVKRMEKLNPGEEFSWRLLKKESERMGIKPEKVFDQNYGEVNAYHKDVWESLYFDTLNY